MDALGIINFEDSIADIEGLGTYRPVPAISFMGRYRIIDFILSNMTNSGIDHVQVYCKEKPRNLIEHLGNGTNYGINSKRGRLRILYGERVFQSPIYNTDAANLILNSQYIEADPCQYVIIAPSYFVYSIDFNDVLRQHIESGAEISVLYKPTNEARNQFLGCDMLTLDKDHRITGIDRNHGTAKSRNISLECYVMTKKIFLDFVRSAYASSSLYWLKAQLRDSAGQMQIMGIPFRGYVGCLNSLREYYRISMELREPEMAEQLFRDGWPIYTQTNDSAPTRYTETASAEDCVIANGCVIEGSLTGCIVGRNVHIARNAVLTNSIIMADSDIAEEVHLSCVIVDKYAKVHVVHNLEGTENDPIYVRRRDRI